jgi:hypothetical protein
MFLEIFKMNIPGRVEYNIFIFIFKKSPSLPHATTCPIDFWSPILVVAKCNRLLRLGPDFVSDDMYERGVPGGALNLSSTGYPDHSLWGSSPARENSHRRTGYRTRDDVVSSQNF